MKKRCLCFWRQQSPGARKFRRMMNLAMAFLMVSVGAVFAGSPNESTGVGSLMEWESDTEALPQVKQKVVTGVVLDQAKDTLPGVSVVIKGSTRGVTTDLHGKFTLPLPEKTDDLIICFSFIGKQKKEITFTGQTHLNVILEDDTQQLDEVVVKTGYQNIKHNELTSAVTTIKMDDIMLPGINTVDKMLEGHVPGMIFMQNSGQVGAAPRLRIRGTSTILGTQEPLWVVDGIIQTDPVNVDPAQINDLDFVNLLGNAISGLNPNDIEQIDVLKDASATALYGTRAANGVIVITTKKGKEGPPTVSYGFTGSLTTRSRYTDRAVDVMNAAERIDFSREVLERGLTYPGVTAWVGYEGALMDYNNSIYTYSEFQERVIFLERNNTDWFDAICQDAFSHNHNLSLSGGSSTMKYYASIGYSRENSVLQKEHGDRYTAAVRVTANYDRFNMQFGLSGNIQEKQHTPSEVGLLNYAYNTSRAVPLLDESGKQWFYPKKMGKSDLSTDFNILNEREHSGQTIKGSGLTLTASVGYRMFENLKAEGTLSYTVNNTNQEIYFGEKSAYVLSNRSERDDLNVIPFGGELRESYTTNNSYTLRGQLSYSKSLDEQQEHRISAMAGVELSSIKYTGKSQTHRGYLSERGRLISTAESGSYPGFEKWLIETAEARGILVHKLENQASVFGSVSYSIRDVYFLNANMRIDASNKFGDKSNDKLLPIWSVSGRWNVKEDVLEHFHLVNSLSLRASYGLQGNMPMNESPELIIKKGDFDSNMGEYRSTVENFPNPNLGWEKTASFNGTLEFALWKSRIRGNVSYFYKKTENAFLERNISVINGVRKYTVNQGTLENQGLEFAFSILPIPPNLGAMSGGKKGFTWRIDPQLGQIVNKLVNKALSSQGKDQTLHDSYTYDDYLSGNAQVAGRPLNAFFSYEFTGLDARDGRPTFARVDEHLWEKYADMKKDKVFQEVMVFSGCRVPYLQGGISNTLGYGNFVFSCNFTYSIGSKVRLLTLYGKDGALVPQPAQNLRRELLNRWKRPGDEKRTNIPGMLSDKNFEESKKPWWKGETSYAFADNIWQMYNNADIRVVSGDYIKLQNISLRYSVPDQLCKKLNLSACYFSMSATNLFTWSHKEMKGQTPTQSGSSSTINVPVSPSYSFNVNVSF